MERNRDKIVVDESTKWLSHLASFFAVVEAGSFTAAARAAGVDKAVLSRRVAKLEEALEVRLLNRTTRSIHVTDEGRKLVEEAAVPLADVASALTRVRLSTGVRGRVKVHSLAALAPVWAEVMAVLQKRHPALTVEFEMGDLFVNLVERGADIAICSGYLPDSSQVVRRIGSWRYRIVASPAWVAAHLEVRHPRDLVPHWLLYGRVPQAKNWRFVRDGEGVDLVMEPRLIANDASALRSFALEGLGVMAAPPFCIEREIATGELVPVLPEWKVDHVHRIWSVVPHRSFVPARVQAVLDAAIEVLASHRPRWDAD